MAKESMKAKERKRAKLAARANRYLWKLYIRII